jgi:hypothetical protein
MVQEMLEVSIIQPSQNDVSSPMVMMVYKNKSSWNMCPNYKYLNKMTIKELKLEQDNKTSPKQPFKHITL